MILRQPSKTTIVGKPVPPWTAARWFARKGQTLVEYALILAVLSIVLILVFSLLSARIIVVFSAITTLLDTAQAGSH